MSRSLVLFFFFPLSLCICLSRAVDAWEKDISVHPLILPRGTCEEVLQLLRSSTKTLPSSLCSMNSYQVRITLLGLVFPPNITSTLSASIARNILPILRNKHYMSNITVMQRQHSIEQTRPVSRVTYLCMNHSRVFVSILLKSCATLRWVPHENSQCLGLFKSIMYHPPKNMFCLLTFWIY